MTTLARALRVNSDLGTIAPCNHQLIQHYLVFDYNCQRGMVS